MRHDDRKAFIREHPCLVCHQYPVDPHHVKSRGAGGKDPNNLVPLCRFHHQQGHQGGWKTFERMYSVDLKAEAEKYEQWFNNDPQDLGF